MSISEAQNSFEPENQELDEAGMPIAPDPAAMEELRQKEIDVALADFRCSEKLERYMQTTLKAQFALETQFVEDNKSELDALLAEYAAMQITDVARPQEEQPRPTPNPMPSPTLSSAWSQLLLSESCVRGGRDSARRVGRCR